MGMPLLGHLDPEFPDPTRPVFESLGDMFRFWIELLDDGIMYWTGRTWSARDVPPDAALKLGGVPTDGGPGLTR